MRILVTACPFFGHVNTVLPFAVAAHRAGHDVVFATGSDFTQAAARHGVATWPIGPTAAAAGMPEALDFFWRTGTDRVADLLPRAESWRPDLVVSDELELAGGVVAERCGAEYVVHGLGIAAAGDQPEALSTAIDAFGSGFAVSGLGERYTRSPYISVCPPALRPSADRRILERKHEVGQADPDYRLPASLTSLPYDRTVHLTLGTVFHSLRPDILTTAIDAVRTLPVNLVVAVGPTEDPRRFGEQPRHVVVERYVPHAALLPECDAVVSHGGAGILLGALAHGLPQLVLPQAADQFANAAAVVRSGAGIALGPDDVTADAIADAVDVLLHGRPYTVAARTVQAEIAAMPSADDAVAALTSGAGSAG